MARDDEPFLERWSRRKHAARRDEPPPAAPAQPAPGEPPPSAPALAPASAAVADTSLPLTAAGAPAPVVELPSLDSLHGLASDYQAFLRPEVDAATRSAALKKLFFDPHFNQMDGLDTYIDDYSKADPIPSAMLRLLNQARHLRLFEDEEAQKVAPETGTEPAASQLVEAAQASDASLPAAPAAAPPLAAAGEESSAVPPADESAPKPGAA